ncbi:helix-turn-helix transcriptional regulator [Glycocaulis profundi]|nr:helix-turn-helix transcriptional regulator [Glycocaulis profundi]
MTSPDNTLQEVGRRLRQARENRGLKLHELARLSGLSAPALSLIETGQRDLRLSTLFRIADALRVPVGTLVEDEPRKGASPDRPDAAGYDLDDYQ